MTRLLARLIDYVLLAIVLAILSSIVLGIFVNAALSGRGSFGPFAGVGYWPTLITGVLGALISLAYFALMESSRGQTLGKMLMKIRTFGPGGGNPTMSEAVKRNIWTATGVLAVIPWVGNTIGGLLGLAAVIAILVTVNGNQATRQGWHDNFAGGTTVIKIG